MSAMEGSRREGRSVQKSEVEEAVEYGDKY